MWYNISMKNRGCCSALRAKNLSTGAASPPKPRLSQKGFNMKNKNRQTASEERYGKSYEEIQLANHENVCALLEAHGLSFDGLSPYEAQMKLAKRVACLVREDRRVR